MQTINHIGFVPFREELKSTHQRRPAFVVWFDEYTKPLSLLIPQQMSCIFCGFAINLPDFQGTSLSNPDVFEFKHACPECFTHYIFNKAPKDLRDQISWPEYLKERDT